MYPILSPGNKWYEAKDFDISKIKIISIIDLYQSDSRKIESTWDASADNNGNITVYLFEGGKEIVISGNGSGKIMANTSMEKMFADFTALERINGLGKVLDTGNVTNMGYLFYHCISLHELDLSGWDVSKVTLFRGTFYCGFTQNGNANLKSLNLAGWNVSEALDMAYMFYGCGNLKYIDVSNWETSKVTDFSHTFSYCFNLRKLDVHRWNTESAITFDGIFNNCRSIKHIDISGWNTFSCQKFNQMFDHCVSLASIKGLENLDTSSGISFEEMFFGCRKLRSLNLSSLNSRNVDGHTLTAYHSSIKRTSNINKILSGCDNLRDLKTGPDFVFDISSVRNVLLEKLFQCGYIIVSPATGSMMPLLRPKIDQVVFKQKDRYNKNDIVLFMNDSSSHLVMHRVIRVLPQGYFIRGDKSHYSDFVFKDRIFASAMAIYRGNREIPCKSLTFKVLSFLSINYNRLYNMYKNKLKQ